ncbi:PilW family protein [uncultured Lamprocystis sp.]|uniref:PilW family protein n=1 Tax=uncultured Lamprocystis sp. TaxID=543132 RepID=UPI0025DAC50E|nr:PilW family protein [uncultured Lamprocystis sp.]
MNALCPPLTAPVRHARFQMCPQRGLTLVEIMIALGLGLLLISAVGAVYLGSNQTYRAAQDGARIQEAGRYALDVIGRSLRQAGYAFVTSNQSAAMPTFAGIPLTGTDGSDGAPDVVTTQRDMTSGDQSCVDSSGSGFIQESFNLDTTNFELQCDGTIAAAPAAPGGGQPLLEGVEDLQFLYGIDTNTDQSADRYVAAPGNWNQVVSARVCVLVRSEDQGSAPSHQTYYNCAGALGTAATDAERFSTATDTRLRRAFVATFTLRNRITVIP